MRTTYPNKPKEHRTPEFKLGQVYRYRQDNELFYEIIGEVIKKSTINVVFKDLLIIKGEDKVPMLEWNLKLPLHSGDAEFEYLGTIEDFPEFKL